MPAPRSSAYPFAELMFANIHNIHVMRESLKKIYELCTPTPINGAQLACHLQCR